MIYQEYNELKILNPKIPNPIILWNTIFILILMLIIILGNNTYYKYFYYKGLICKIDNQYYVKLLVKDNEISNINSDKMLINGNIKSYQIKEISDDYKLDQLFNKYYEVIMKVNIDKKLLINNNIVEVIIKGNKTTLINEIKLKIKRG